MTDWRAFARAAHATGPVALVTVLATEGSAPRGPGARMVVTPGRIAGTIGGGRLEYRAVEQARAILDHPPGSWRVQDWPLGPLLGQCCGGRVRLLVEHLGDMDWMDGPTLATLHADRIVRTTLPERAPAALRARGPMPTAGTAFPEPDDGPRHPLYLFGAGHIGRAIAERIHGLPVTLAWFDSRPDHDWPGVSVQDEDALVACARSAPADAAALILTHDHHLDYRLTAAALAGDAKFVGLIGSATKRARFLSRLSGDGVDASRLTCPIGIPGLTGKEPAVIAVAVLAQILMVAAAESTMQSPLRSVSA